MTEPVRFDVGVLPRTLDAMRIAALSPLGIGFLTACCLIALKLRAFGDVEPGYGFLRWNLFLAWVPLVLAYALVWSARRSIGWLVLPSLAAAWIVFLPNAPYLVTDLVHLREAVNLPNLLTLTLVAVTGLLIGVKALQLVEGAAEQHFGAVAGVQTVRIVVILTAVGVYVGRVLRWNSWNVVSHPHELLHAILRAPSQPTRAGIALLVTLVFAASFYWVYRVMSGPRWQSTQALLRGRPDSR